MRNKKLVAAVLTLLMLVIGAGVVWYLVTPQTADAQFAYAQKLERTLRGDAVTKGLEQVRPQMEKTVRAYEAVEGRFGKSDKAAEAWGKIASLEEEVGKEDDKAIATHERIARDYAGDANAGQALIDAARLIRKQADGLKINKPAEAVERYKQAIAKLEEYRKRFPDGKQADAALMEIGRIWHDGIGEPLANAMDAYEKLLKDYPTSEHRAEAMYRLAQILEYAREYQRALQLYSELTELYPKSPWADKALFAKGKLLAEQMDKQKEAAEEFKKLAEEYPDSPLKGTAEAEARQAGEKAAQGENEEYGRGRYGGALPPDTLLDKPIPSQAEMMRKFSQQKLDAQKYDLDITLAPADQRITVKGTLNFVNRGEEKKELLFMLARGADVTSVTLNGTAVTQELMGETWKLTLPTPLAKDASAVLTFAYTGQFAAPSPGNPSKGIRPKDKPKSESPETKPAGPDMLIGQATAPATKPGKISSATATAPSKGKPRYMQNPQLALGEFGYGLSGGAWYPITIIGDVFEARMTYRTPGGVEVVANGALEKREPAKGNYIFETRRPVFGLYFCYGNYKVAEKKVGDILYFTYLRESNAAKSDEYINVAADILSFYSDKFGKYPYEKMAIVESPLPPFLGGVGPASMMVLHEGMVAQKDVPSTLLAHELAHQWFGNLVPINLMDTDYHQWLSEGFATYADALYTEKTEGPAALAKHMERYGQLYFQFQMMFGRRMQPVRDVQMGSPLYRPVVYEKGAIVLHALRKVMGDEKFFHLLQTFVGTYADKPTTVRDFRRMASEVMGEELDWFFAQWFDGITFAHWEITAVTSEGEKPVKVKVAIRQPQDLIRAPVDVTLLGPGGERHLQANLWIDKYEHEFAIDCPFVPVKVVLDEGNWTLKRPGGSHKWPLEKKSATK